MNHGKFVESIYRGAEAVLGVAALLIPFFAIPQLF